MAVSSRAESANGGGLNLIASYLLPRWLRQPWSILRTLPTAPPQKPTCPNLRLLDLPSCGATQLRVARTGPTERISADFWFMIWASHGPLSRMIAGDGAA